MPTILIVDDLPDMRDNLALLLEASGYQTLNAGDGLEALEMLENNTVDLVLADIAMPRMNGYQLYERLRQEARWVTLPFIFLTARAMDSDIRFGKELGADDYLTKPIQPEDLLATVRGRLRRARQLAQIPVPNIAEDVLEIGRLRIASAQHRAWLNEQLINLSAREFTLLEALARRAGQVISPEALLQITHELDIRDPNEASSLLRPLIRTLRRKLGYEVGAMGCIENVRGVGYRLNPP